MQMSIADELFDLSNATEQALSRAREATLKAALAALEKACNDAKRSWSGSNLGYHANVYYHGLQPRPANAQFSPEWGLMDVWPTHQPDRGWEVMDEEAVSEIILTRAGISDLDAIKKRLDALRDDLSRLKERGFALLTPLRAIPRIRSYSASLRAWTTSRSRTQLQSRFRWRKADRIGRGTRRSFHRVPGWLRTSAFWRYAFRRL